MIYCIEHRNQKVYVTQLEVRFDTMQSQYQQLVHLCYLRKIYVKTFLLCAQLHELYSMFLLNSFTSFLVVFKMALQALNLLHRCLSTSEVNLRAQSQQNKIQPYSWHELVIYIFIKCWLLNYWYDSDLIMSFRMPSQFFFHNHYWIITSIDLIYDHLWRQFKWTPFEIRVWIEWLIVSPSFMYMQLFTHYITSGLFNLSLSVKETPDLFYQYQMGKCVLSFQQTCSVVVVAIRLVVSPLFHYFKESSFYSQWKGKGWI